MKIIVTEEQVKNLINQLHEQSSFGDEIKDFISHPIDKLHQYYDSIKNYFDTPTGQTTNNDSQQLGQNSTELMNPLGHSARITSGFGPRNIGGMASHNHKGIDMASPSGSEVMAAGDGTIMFAGDTTPNGCGGFVMIDHGGGLQTKYCHLREWVVSKGQQVKKGQVIGYSGGGHNDPYKGDASGQHLHFEVVLDGKSVDPLSNPQYGIA